MLDPNKKTEERSATELILMTMMKYVYHKHLLLRYLKLGCVKGVTWAEAGRAGWRLGAGPDVTRGERAGCEAEGVVHMRRPRRLKVTLNS